MALTIVTAKDPQLDRSVSVEYNFGSTLEEAIAMFGPEAILNGFVADAKVGLQAHIRAKIRGTKEKDSDVLKQYTDEEIKTSASEWKPGTKTREAADPVAKLRALLDKLPESERAAIIEAAMATAE